MIENNESKNSQNMPHIVNMDNRKNLIISGVKEVEHFDDGTIESVTCMGKLIITGDNLNIKKLNLDQGDLEVTGKIKSLNYVEDKIKLGSKFLHKLFG